MPPLVTENRRFTPHSPSDISKKKIPENLRMKGCHSWGDPHENTMKTRQKSKYRLILLEQSLIIISLCKAATYTIAIRTDISIFYQLLPNSTPGYIYVERSGTKILFLPPSILKLLAF